MLAVRCRRCLGEGPGLFEGFGRLRIREKCRSIHQLLSSSGRSRVSDVWLSVFSLPGGAVTCCCGFQA